MDQVGGPAWGYHGYEYALALGNLLHDVAGEEAAWQPRFGPSYGAQRLGR